MLIDYIITLEDFDLDNILIDKKSHENILIHGILYKTLIDPKRLHIGFDKIHGFIRIYYGNRNLTLFGSEKYDKSKKWHHVYFFSLFCKYKS